MFIPPRTNNAPLPTCVCTSPPLSFSLLVNVFILFLIYLPFLQTAPNPKIYDISSKFTVEAIIRPNMKVIKQEVACPIVSKHSHLCGNPLSLLPLSFFCSLCSLLKSNDDTGWELRFSSTPSFLVTIECNFFESKASSNIYLEDRWYHIAGIYDSTSVCPLSSLSISLSLSPSPSPSPSPYLLLLLLLLLLPSLFVSSPDIFFVFLFFIILLTSSLRYNFW